MKKRLALSATAALIAVVSLGSVAAPAPAAPGGPSSPATGGGEDTSVSLVDARFADGNTFGRFAVTGVMEGTFDGTYVADVDIVIHANGRIEANGLVTFTGSIAGCDATTVVFRLVATGAFPATGGPSVSEGRLVAVGSEVQANLSFDEVGSFFTYEGSYHCGE